MFSERVSKEKYKMFASRVRFHCKHIHLNLTEYIMNFEEMASGR